MIGVVDCGLSSLKVTLVDERGVVVESAVEGYATTFASDVAEQDPESWWGALRGATARLSRLREVDVLVPTGHMHALVAVDEEGRPLLPCLTLHDRRGAAELHAFDPKAFYSVTGQLLDPSLPFGKLLWLRRSEPALLKQIRTVFAPKDYLRMRLCGARVTEPIDAAGMGLYDLAAGDWSSDLVVAAGVQDALPEIVPSIAVVGRVSSTAARELGVTAGIPVLAGAGDDIELLGATGGAAGVAVEHVGTTGGVLAYIDDLQLDPLGDIEVYPAGFGARYAAGASTPNSGAVLDWIARTLSLDVDLAVDAASEVDGLIALPFLRPERAAAAGEASAGAVFGLTFAHGREDLAHAFLRGTACGLRELVEKVQSFAGKIDLLVSSGGQSASTPWAAMRASMYGLPIEIRAHDPTALGCAALALASRDGRDPTTVAASFLEGLDSKLIAPDQALSERYEGHYRRYLQLKEVVLAAMPAAPSSDAARPRLAASDG